MPLEGYYSAYNGVLNLKQRNTHREIFRALFQHGHATRGEIANYLVAHLSQTSVSAGSTRPRGEVMDEVKKLHQLGFLEMAQKDRFRINPALAAQLHAFVKSTK